MTRERVALFGASGTMGFRAFQELWKRRDRYDLALLIRPSSRNKKRFLPYVREAGLDLIPGCGVVENDGLKIVWGDATCFADVAETIRGADAVLDAMALISPHADYCPEMAWAVNVGAIRHIVRAIEAEPGGVERIRLVYTGSVAQTGDRLGCVHWGRVGDPLKPGIFDLYAVTKIASERAVMESDIQHWVSLRMSYILPTSSRDYISLLDPIMFHLPPGSFMENITDRDAGYGMVKCLDIPGGSDFWRRAYNMGGGSQMRCTAYDYVDSNFKLMGLSGIEACAERRWFALRNFHLQYYEDSHVLNEYLHFWRDSMEDFWQALYEDMPRGIRLLPAVLRRVRPLRKLAEWVTYGVLKWQVENHRNGTVHWYKHRNDMRITAFYKDYQTYESLPGWGVDMPVLNPEPACTRLDHGYDESKERLEIEDLRGAAAFRGGECLSAAWDGDLYTRVEWRCGCGHKFAARPYTVLKAGHWCPDCAPPPWDCDEEARRNPFFAQVWYPNHDPDEHNFYPAECVQDIAGAGRL